MNELNSKLASATTPEEAEPERQPGGREERSKPTSLRSSRRSRPARHERHRQHARAPGESPKCKCAASQPAPEIPGQTCTP